MASAYLFHLRKNHAFVDGNKRAAAMSALVFLDINKCRKLPSSKEFERITMQVAEGRMEKQQLINWFERILKKRK